MPKDCDLSKSSLLITALFTKGTFSVIRDMVQALQFGLITPNMKASGERTRPMDAAREQVPTVTFTMASGRMIKPVATVFTSMLMAPNMRDTGRTISKMAKV